MTEIKHGTLYGYVGQNCRCDECRTAATEYNRQSKAKRREKGLPPGDPRHGTKNGYMNYGCRCQDCTIAHTGKAFAIREAGFGHEVYVKELGGWFTLGAKV